VNESYRTQADVIKTVHDMDVLKMAKANVTVLKQLEQCTDKLEDFNEYLESIKGYTDSIHRFETLFNENESKYHVLQEIRDFFNRYKGSIASVTTDADAALKNALGQLKESTVKEMHDVNNTFVELSENFKKVIKDEKETFQKFSSELRTQFDSQMKQLPQLNKQLEQIAAIPGHLDKLVDRIEKANAKYADNLKQTVEKSIKANQMGGSAVGVAGSSSIPSWMKVTAFCALIIIAATCVFNVYNQLFPSEEEKKPQTEQQTVQSIEPAQLAQPKVPTNIAPENNGQSQQAGEGN
jgi:oligoribonuclease (3'-5' exoribonuclease)